MGGGHELALGFNRARSRHGDEFVAADSKVEHRHDGPLAPRVDQNIGRFGKSFQPAFAHTERSIRPPVHREGSVYRRRRKMASIERLTRERAGEAPSEAPATRTPMFLKRKQTRLFRPTPLPARDSQTPHRLRPRYPTRLHLRRAVPQSARRSEAPQAMCPREPLPPDMPMH